MNSRLHAYRSTLRARGMSLIELLVGMTIGLVLTLGLFTMIASSSQAFKVQDDFARMQESATFALRYVGDSVRHAGFFGSLTNTGNYAIQGVTITTDCGSAGNPPAVQWATFMRDPLVAFADITTATVNGLFPCIVATNFQDGPILVTRLAMGYRIPDPNNDGNRSDGLALQQNYTTTVYVQSDPYAAVLFYGTAYAALRGGGTTTKFLPTGRDYDIFQFNTHVYYLRPCSRPAAGTTCTAAADGGQPIPTLVRQELVGSAMVEVPLVEGVERIDFRYGIDNDQNGVPEQFLRVPAATDWANIVSVKVTVLVRSPNLLMEHDDSGKTYDLDGDGAVDYRCTDFTGVNPRACNYKRKVFSQIFQLRNIAQRRGA